MSPAVASFLEREEPGLLEQVAWRKAYGRATVRLYSFFAEWRPEMVARNMTADELERDLPDMVRAVERWTALVRSHMAPPATVTPLRRVEGDAR
jgi:hypothetical protein